MMKDLSIPTQPSMLSAQGTKLAAGLALYGTALDIANITAAQMTTAVSKFNTAQQNFLAARSAQKTSGAALEPALAAMDVWLLAAKNTLAARFGVRWSNEWAQAGFTAATTAIPRRIDQQVTLVGDISACLRRNPTWSISQLNITPTKGEAIALAVVTTQQAYANATETVKAKGDTWQPAYDALLTLERQTVSALFSAMGPSDPRWTAFGLPLPSAPRTPGIPENLAAQLVENGDVLLTCDATVRATRYRFRMMLSEDTDPRLVATSPMPSGTVSGLTPGQTVWFTVEAVNGNSQGRPSEPLEFTVGLRTAGATATEAKVALPARAAVGGNGHGKSGHGNGHRVPALG